VSAGLVFRLRRPLSLFSISLTCGSALGHFSAGTYVMYACHLALNTGCEPFKVITSYYFLLLHLFQNFFFQKTLVMTFMSNKRQLSFQKKNYIPIYHDGRSEHSDTDKWKSKTSVYRIISDRTLTFQGMEMSLHNQWAKICSLGENSFPSSYSIYSGIICRIIYFDVFVLNSPIKVRGHFT